MNRFLSSLICLILMCQGTAVSAQGILSGQVTRQNSGNKPIPGALVKAGLSTQTETGSKGDFSMTLPGKAPGYEVRISVESPGMEVVNKEKLQRYALRADATVPLKIYLCPVGEWERNALAYYNINRERITAQYRAQVATLKTQLSDQAQLNDSLATLAEQHQSALNQAEELAKLFAVTNLDDASRMFREAHDFYTRGEIDSALLVLDEDKLDELAAEAIEEQINADKLEVISKAKRDTAVQGYTTRARLLITQLQFDDAFRNFEKAVALDSLDFDLNFEYACFLQEQNHFSEAVVVYQKCLHLSRNEYDNSVILNNLGNVFLALHEYDKGRQALRKALEIRKKMIAKRNSLKYAGDISSTLHNLGNFYIAQKAYMDGIKKYEEALVIRKALAEQAPISHLDRVAATLNNLGNAYGELPDHNKELEAHEEAMRIRRKLVSQNPKDKYLDDLSETLNSLGGVYSHRGEFVRSREAYKEALKISRNLALKNPESYMMNVAITLNNQGLLYAKQNDYSSGIVAYKEAILIFENLSVQNPKAFLPSLATSLNNLALGYSILGELDSSLIYMNESTLIRIRLAQNDIPAFGIEAAGGLMALGSFIYESGEYNLPMQYWIRADSILRHCPDSHRKNRYQKRLTKLLRLPAPTDPIILLMNLVEVAGEIEKKVKFQEDIIRILESVYITDSTNSEFKGYLSYSLGSLSRSKMFLGDFPGSENSANRGLKVDPSEEWINTNLAHALLFQGKFEKAKKLYKQYKGQSYDNTRFWEEVFLADLDELEAEGITHPDVKKIRKILTK